MRRIYCDFSAALITNKYYEVLLQKKDIRYPWFPGKWCLFGGCIENGESPREALNRELKEEGIETVVFTSPIPILTQKYIETCHNGVRSGKHYFFQLDFKGKISDIRLQEGGGFGFFARKELPALPLAEYTAKFLKYHF